MGNNVSKWALELASTPECQKHLENNAGHCDNNPPLKKRPWEQSCSPWAKKISKFSGGAARACPDGGEKKLFSLHK